jgi:hypothetical protein
MAIFRYGRLARQKRIKRKMERILAELEVSTMLKRHRAYTVGEIEDALTARIESLNRHGQAESEVMRAVRWRTITDLQDVLAKLSWACRQYDESQFKG